MLFSLDVRRARKGDCLLLHFGSKQKPGLVLIDGGPKSVYAPHLKPRLQEIKTQRHLGPGVPLHVDLMAVSHVDDDHIQGLLDFTAELLAAHGAPLARVASCWHNSFDAIIGNDPKELTSAMTAQFGTASLNGAFPDDADLDSETVNVGEEVVRDNLKVLASIGQGFRLRGDIKKLKIPLNTGFDGNLVIAGKKRHKVPGGLTLLVAGPMQHELRALQEKHDEWLRTLKKKKPSGGASLAAYVDKSVPNLSSLVLLAESGGKRVLLTGDARGDKILEGLESVGALSKGGAMHVDILKCPHHGSSNNVTADFFERITADHYVLSGDGEHGNPERETLEMLFKARGKQPFQVHLTYSLAEIDAKRKADWEKEQAKEKKRKAEGGNRAPRKNWSAQTQSLKAFFAKTKLVKGQIVAEIKSGETHVIDLLDPLGF